MKKILILYFSGAGSVSTIVSFMKHKLSKHFHVEAYSLEKQAPHIGNYDAVIIGTPVYHAAPARLVSDYFDDLPQLLQKIPAFVFSAHGLHSLNTNRILAKQLAAKNIITIYDSAYRCPASDGALIAPFIKRFFEFEKGISKKVNRDLNMFLKALKQRPIGASMPKFSFWSIVNAPNKAASQHFMVKIHMDENSCNGCGLCVRSCPHTALVHGKNKKSIKQLKNCENCYRCVHHCPNAALSLFKRKTPKKLLVYKRKSD